MTEPLKIWRSPYSEFGKMLKIPDDRRDETVTAVDAYTDDTLRSIADSGFNAVWVHGLLRNMVRSDVFPEFGRHAARHLCSMRKLIERADRFGIKVLVYMQPPRALAVTHAFWKRHPETGGHEVDFVTDDGFQVRMRSFCTSTPMVRRYLKDSAARLASELPDLGGVILITASEYPSHCWSRCGNTVDVEGRRIRLLTACKRCAPRAPVDIVCEIIQQVRNGIRSQKSRMPIIAWNWSWNFYEKTPCAGIISRLPKDVILMVGFERGGFRTILGKRRVIDEYALSYSGPSPQFRGTLKTAREHGIEVIAKLQIGTTHELATVPSLPLIGNLYEKAAAMRKLGVSGFMGCWNFGNMTSANTAAFNRFLLARRRPTRRTALKDFAREYFPDCKPDLVVAAWERFGEAMKSYPFSIPFLYNSPVNYTLAYPLRPGPLSGRPMGRAWQMDPRGDDLAPSLDPYSLADVIRGLGAVAQTWKGGVTLLERGLRSCTGDTAHMELDNARVCYHVFRSAWNTYRVYRLRRHWTDAKLDAFRRIAANERANLEQVSTCVQRNPRFGYHSEPQAAMFDTASIRRKMRQLGALL